MNSHKTLPDSPTLELSCINCAEPMLDTETIVLLRSGNDSDDWLHWRCFDQWNVFVDLCGKPPVSIEAARRVVFAPAQQERWHKALYKSRKKLNQTKGEPNDLQTQTRQETCSPSKVS
jgi:hypothetical protein